MSLQQVRTGEAYESSAPLSQAIRHEDTVYVSGNVPVDPATGELVEGGVGPQTRQVLENVEAVLTEAGSSTDSVVRAGVFMTDMDAFGEMNAVYEEFMSEPYPARTTVRAEMANPDILVEIDVIAAVEE